MFGSSLPFVGFGGSRSLPSVASPGGLVASVVSSVVRSGRGVAVGCASGADAAVLSFRLSLPFPPSSGPQLAVFAVGGPGLGGRGSGFWRGSAWPVVQQAAVLAQSSSSSVVVRWWAGGGAPVPLRQRLRARSVALVQAVAASGPQAGFVFFVAGGWPASRGSWGSVLSALRLGSSVVVFPVGCSVSCFPRSFSGVGPVRWVPAAQSGAWSSGFRAVGAAR